MFLLPFLPYREPEILNSNNDVIKAGYTFVGWSGNNTNEVNNDYTAEWTESTITPETNTIWCAVWAKDITLTITYNMNGHGNQVANTTETVTQYHNSNISSSTSHEITVTLPEAVEDGYRFDGWKVNNTGETYVASYTITITATQTVTMYAQWTALNIGKITITSTYSSNSDSFAMGFVKITKDTQNWNFMLVRGKTITLSGLARGTYTVTVSASTNHSAEANINSMEITLENTDFEVEVSIEKTKVGTFYSGSASVVESIELNSEREVEELVEDIVEETVEQPVEITEEQPKVEQPETIETESTETKTPERQEIPELPSYAKREIDYVYDVKRLYI